MDTAPERRVALTMMGLGIAAGAAGLAAVSVIGSSGLLLSAGF
jgi:hypothetical protein